MTKALDKKKKIEKLAEALEKAQESIDLYYKENPGQDGGTCNLDSVCIKLHRWRTADIEAVNALCKNVSISPNKLDSWLHRGFRFIRFNTEGQGDRNAQGVQVGNKVLQELCKEVFADDPEFFITVYYQMD